MTIAAPWRDRGIGKALLERAIAWAKDVGHYKISLEVWPHNTGARALYNTFGFDEEGYLRKQWRRANGELWDSVIMGLVLEGDH
jgi:RimJ/RimL family protein N-acetyltransferase